MTTVNQFASSFFLLVMSADRYCKCILYSKRHFISIVHLPLVFHHVFFFLTLHSCRLVSATLGLSNEDCGSSFQYVLVGSHEVNLTLFCILNSHPIKSNKYRTAKAAIVVCSAIWVTSVILSKSHLKLHCDQISVLSLDSLNMISGLTSWVTMLINSSDPGLYLRWIEHQSSDTRCLRYTLAGRRIRGWNAGLHVILSRAGLRLPVGPHRGFLLHGRSTTGTLGPKTVNGQSDARKKSHRKVTVMVLAVVTAYLICWLPYW